MDTGCSERLVARSVSTSSNKTSQTPMSEYCSVDRQMQLRHAGHNRARREKGQGEREKERDREGGMRGCRAGACTGWWADLGAHSCRPAQVGTGRRKHRLAQVGGCIVYEPLPCRPSTEQLQNNYRTTTEQLTEQLQNNS